MKTNINNKIKRFMGKKASISYLQILILIISTFAFCYIIYDATESVSAVRGRSSDPVLSEFLSGYVCCEEDNNGNTCQYVEASNCTAGSNQWQEPCNYVNECKIGCCYGDEFGLCSETSPKVLCDREGGEWSDSCSIPKCEERCCVLGSQAKLTTERNCEVESGTVGDSGIPIDFRTDISNEIECIFLTERDQEGACVFESNEVTTCLYITGEECLSRTGNVNDFNAGVFCSDDLLNTDCAAHDYDGCVDGEESVYWFDSCGNKEDIKEECGLLFGSICGEYRVGVDSLPSSGGDYSCRDLSCVADNGMTYDNGESWCEYEGQVGDGKDVVGSRHIKHMCFMGEERIEPCADYRNQICVGSVKNLGGGETLSEAVCRQNNWQQCFETTSRGTGSIDNNQNPDCIVKTVDLTDDDEDTFKFSLSVPAFPPGFDYRNSYESAASLCNLGSQTCTIMEVKEWCGFFKTCWECQYNCGCDSGSFAQQMNDLCINLGDCGGYVNTEGKYEANYVSDAGGVDGNQYKQYAKPERNLDMAESKALDFSGNYGFNTDPFEEGGTGIGVAGIALLGVQGIQLLGLTKTLATTKGISGIGGLGLVGTGGEGVVYDKLVGESAKVLAGKDASVNAIAAMEASPEAASYAGFGNMLQAFGAGMAVVSLLGMGGIRFRGINSLLAGVAIGGALMVAANAGFIIGWGFVQFLGWVGLAIVILGFILGIGKTRETNIGFQCLPWIAPDGGSDCSKCNPKNEFDVPCTEYKCHSLGLGCDLINKGTEDQQCINLCTGSFSSPRIEPSDDISDGYEYRQVSSASFSIRADNGDCIDEFTEVEYGIKTDKPAQCKIGTSLMETYDQMTEGYFGGKNSYVTDHDAVLFYPSISAFRNHYNLTQQQIEDLGGIEYYVKCKEACEGNTNLISFKIESCVNPGPDLTAPWIKRVIPASGSFVKYGETEKNISLWVNEPAECKWDTRPERNYDDMVNQMACATGIDRRSEWPCTTTLTGVNNNSMFYFKCKDQPWPLEPGESRNPNTDDYPYELSLSTSQLSIVDFKPENNYKFNKGVEPVVVDLNVRTAGGAEDGIAICEWQLQGFSFGEFDETGSNYHTKIWNYGFRGNHNINFYCEDVAGNNATASTSFKIDIDTSGPRIIRVYFDGGLKIITNEDSECRYGFNRNFRFDNETIMGGDGFEHIADWQLKTYYIQCKDQFNTKGGKIRVKSYNLL